MKKLLIICGPTATGKTSLGIYLAKKFNGEIVSADSRQVYKGMDIATGKDIKSGKWIKNHWEIEGIPIWLLDVVKPNEEFSVAHYTDLAWKIIRDIWQRGKLPILVGGTGFYIKAVINNIPTKGISPNWPLRKQLESKAINILFNELAELDSFRAAQMNVSDRQNKRRLIRAIEVARWRVENRLLPTEKLPQFDALFIGLTAPYPFLYQQIDKRVEERVKINVEREIKRLIKKGYNFENSVLRATIGYKEWEQFLAGKSVLNEVIQKWKFDEHAYARRQMTWFKKQKPIHWFDIHEKRWQDKIEKKVLIWYTQNNAKKD